jgi:pyrimidine operon attenuation protein/uracil phosphoribosyltransferase
MPTQTTLLNALNIQRVVTRIAHEIAERNDDSKAVVLAGVQTGGVRLAERLAAILESIWGHPVPLGRLDVNMHRDDLNQNAAPEVHPTVMPFDVSGKTVVLVDDVLSSGRTARAALDALMDFGRPDRGHRELPIKADFVGKNIPTSRRETVEVSFKEDGSDDAVLLTTS